MLNRLRAWTSKRRDRWAGFTPEDRRVISEAITAYHTMSALMPGRVQKINVGGQEFAVLHYEDLEVIAQQGGVKLTAGAAPAPAWTPKP